MMNGSLLRVFKPHRGLSQNDPLSSYLFISCEVLSSMSIIYILGARNDPQD